MKRIMTLLLAALVAAPAAAQTIIITRPATPAAQTSVPSLQEVPSGWRVLTGRIRAPQEVRLPAGSMVVLSVQDVTRVNGNHPTLVKVNFPATRLSAPYQVQYNPARLNPRRVYVLNVRVTGPNGNVLYTSSQQQELPRTQNAVMDLQVKPAR
ncbi:hypothetical protein Dcar01_03001 [Deinococcus carri]|uniref:Lipoprotein n=1 Tax=Deinococcus carri TaxID=1211323 RepID=A0ABP9WA74_9DEIO